MTTVVLFDAGNTLVELDYDTLAGIAGRHGLATSGPEFRAAAGLARADFDAFIRGETASTESTDSRSFFIEATYRHLGLPRDLWEPLTRDISRVLQKLWTVPSPECVETLEVLNDRGYRLGVVSNSDGTVKQLLEACGLGRYFQAIVDSALVGCEKPDPEIFAIALERLGAQAGDALYVGDLPSVDVTGARAAGVAPLLYDPFDVFPAANTPRIRSFRELPLFLEGTVGEGSGG